MADQIDPSRRWLDERLSDVIFLIARAPEEFPKERRTNLYAATSEGRPRFIVWFTFDDKRVYLLGIIEI